MIELRKGLRLWAIGGKGWTEIRASRLSPKPHTTEVEKIVPVTIRGIHRIPSPVALSGWVWVPYEQERNRRVVLKSTTFSGGKVLGVLHGRPRSVPINQVRPVPKRRIKWVLEKLEEQDVPA